jgi:serine/threonine-protein kinase
MHGHPAKIGKYEVLDVIGRGGMGVVYKATDPHIGRFVAIKMITGGDLERFYAEAKSTGNLQCPNIVTVYDLGDHDGDPYLVMEYLEGVSLESIIASGRRMNLLEKVRVIIDVCNGLSYAHQRNVIHRDIKPGNIMVLNDGTAKIVDFGIARIGDRRMTKTNQVIGSLHYMSPEQIQNHPLDSGTDIFSTGVVLYQLLTGTLPFDSPDTAAILMKIIHDPPAPLDSYIQNYPRELDQVINRALAKSRDERYESARDLAFDLTRIVELQRQEAVTHFLKGAEGAMQRAEWTKAREQLGQILSIDRQHVQAHRMLGEVQENIRRQQRTEQVRQLRSRADEALVDLQYGDALRFLDQAVALDNTNQDIIELRNLVQAAKLRSEKLQIALHRAETAHHAGDLDEAKQAIDEALALDPNETQAKVLQHVIAKQLEERARQVQMRKFLDEARNLLAARKVTQAFETLKSAEMLDEGSLELQSLLKLANTAREQETRKADLARLAQQIEEALIREDYASASSQAEAGLQKYPREQGLLKLKTLADAQRKRLEEKAYVRSQFTSANTLLDSGKTFEALSILEKALQRVPGEAQLESLRSIIKERLTQEESEDHLRRSLEGARGAVAAGDFDEAVRILQSANQEFPDARDVNELLHTAEALVAKERSVQQALASAQKLLVDKEPQRAVQLLDGALQQQSDRRILDLLADARRQLEQFQRGMERAINEGERILNQHGSEEAAAFLQAQPRQYADALHFQDLWERVRKRGAAEVLDRQLARESSPEVQVQLAEAAQRKSPGNEEIEKTLATVRERKTRICSVVEKARDLEFSLRYEESAQELGRLRELYPEYPHLEAEILRLAKLDEQRKLLSNQPSNSPPNNVATANLLKRKHLSATDIVRLPVTSLPGQDLVPSQGASPTQEPETPERMPSVRAGARPSLRGIRALLLGMVAALALLGAAYLHFRRPDTIAVGSSSISSPDKPGSNAGPTVPRESERGKESPSNPDIAAGAGVAAQRKKTPPVSHEKVPASLSAKPGSLGQNVPGPAAAGSISTAKTENSALSSVATTTNKEGGKDDTGAQATSTIPFSQPPPSLQPKPRVEANASPSISQPDSIASASKVEPAIIVKPTQDSEAVRTALRSYEDAYASMDIGVLQKVWPSLSRDQVKNLKDGFRGAQAVKVSLECGDPALSGDTARVRCEQSMAYTRDGRRQPSQTVSVAILLRKGANGTWLVDKVQ